MKTKNITLQLVMTILLVCSLIGSTWVMLNLEFIVPLFITLTVGIPLSIFAIIDCHNTWQRVSNYKKTGDIGGLAIEDISDELINNPTELKRKIMSEIRYMN